MCITRFFPETYNRPIIGNDLSHVFVIMCCVLLLPSGPAKEIFTAGAAVQKGAEGSQQKAYCQVSIHTLSELVDTLCMDGEDMLKTPKLL